MSQAFDFAVAIILKACVTFCALTITGWFFLSLLKEAGVCKVMP